MKAINVNAAVVARAELEQVKKDLRFYRGLCKDCPNDYDKARIARAEAAEAEKRAAYDAALQPLAAAIAEAEKRARVRLIDAGDVIEALQEIEDALSIPKKALVGIEASVDPNAQHIAKAYKGRPESTQFSAVYKSGGWRVVNIWRGDCRLPCNRYEIKHTDESRAAIIKRFTAWS